MNARSTQETLESLRVTLQKLEQAADPTSNGPDVIELKQILLNRIAELEALHALNPGKPEPSEVPAMAVVREDDPAKTMAETIPLEKLD